MHHWSSRKKFVCMKFSILYNILNVNKNKSWNSKNDYYSTEKYFSPQKPLAEKYICIWSAMRAERESAKQN